MVNFQTCFKTAVLCVAVFISVASSAQQSQRSSWPAVIQVKEQAEELTIDRGRNAGVAVKQQYRIVREGEPLYDRNGNLVGVDVIEIAVIKITRVEENIAYGKITKIHKDPATKKKYLIYVGDSTRRLK